MLALDNGLKNSLIVLEILRNDEELNNYIVDIGTFLNFRGKGLTFTVHANGKIYLKKPYTFCIYGERNSDMIIINRKENFSNFNGDLPYQSDGYLSGFQYNEYYQCAMRLKELIIELFEDK